MRRAALRAAGADQELRPAAFRLPEKVPDVALAVAHDNGSDGQGRGTCEPRPSGQRAECHHYLNSISHEIVETGNESWRFRQHSKG